MQKGFQWSEEIIFSLVSDINYLTHIKQIWLLNKEACVQLICGWYEAITYQIDVRQLLEKTHFSEYFPKIYTKRILYKNLKQYFPKLSRKNRIIFVFLKTDCQKCIGVDYAAFFD